MRRVAVWGNVRLSTPALVFLLRQGVPVFFLSLEGFLSAFRRGHLTPAHAQAQEGGVYLNEEGRRRLIELLEGRFLEEVAHPLGFRKPLGEMIELQAQRLKKTILGKEAYTPYYLRIH